MLGKLDPTALADGEMQAKIIGGILGELSVRERDNIVADHDDLRRTRQAAS